MKSSRQDLKVQITKAVRVYIFGCCVFVLIAIVSIWVGYLYIMHFDEYDLPAALIILPIAGVILIWEMIKSFNFKKKIPDSYRPIKSEDFPILFDIIFEITNTLGISPIRRVYICPGTTAAVFIQPKLQNILLEPQKDLVLGLVFLTQMDDDEIRAMLYHEFGHFVQSEMNSSLSVYTIGQFSRSFVSIKEPLDTNDTWKMNTRLQVLFFTYFSICLCNKINRLYLKLSKQMEYDAITHHNDPLYASNRKHFKAEEETLPAYLSKYFSRVIRITRLREIKVLLGFTRVDAPDPDADAQDNIVYLSKTSEKWLPAVDINGEGIFIEFNRETLDAWNESNEVSELSKRYSKC